MCICSLVSRSPCSIPSSTFFRSSSCTFKGASTLQVMRSFGFRNRQVTPAARTTGGYIKISVMYRQVATVFLPAGMNESQTIRKPLACTAWAASEAAPMIWPVTPGILSNPLPERIATIKGVKLAGEKPRGIAAAAEGRRQMGLIETTGPTYRWPRGLANSSWPHR